jgi:Holliday junction resolvasome RuvABC endonuclease subunit
MTTVRILGIDPGLRITGFGVIDKVGQIGRASCRERVS